MYEYWVDDGEAPKWQEYGEELRLALIQKSVADKRFTEIERMKDDNRLDVYVKDDRETVGVFLHLGLLWRTISQINAKGQTIVGDRTEIKCVF